MDSCIHGHEFTPANTKYQRQSKYRVRLCVTCYNERKAIHLAKLRAATQARRAQRDNPA